MPCKKTDDHDVCLRLGELEFVRSLTLVLDDIVDASGSFDVDGLRHSRVHFVECLWRIAHPIGLVLSGNDVAKNVQGLDGCSDSASSGERQNVDSNVNSLAR